MKKHYKAPVAEKVVFDYSENIAASGVSKCKQYTYKDYVDTGRVMCDDTFTGRQYTVWFGDQYN